MLIEGTGTLNDQSAAVRIDLHSYHSTYQRESDSNRGVTEDGPGRESGSGNLMQSY